MAAPCNCKAMFVLLRKVYFQRCVSVKTLLVKTQRQYPLMCRYMSSGDKRNDSNPQNAADTGENDAQAPDTDKKVTDPSTSSEEQRSSDIRPNGNGNRNSADRSNDRLGHVMQLYEDYVGLTEVKHAQDKVVQAEQRFLQVQEDRRTMQQELLTVQAEVRTVGAELEKTSRTDSRYIDLVKKEHEILIVEREMSNKIKNLDKAERDFFSLLSAAVRESHEKERARAEKTKYWSIIGSIIGAIIGIAGSTWNNMRRMKEMRSIITESGERTKDYKKIADELLQTVSTKQSKLDQILFGVADGKLEGLNLSDSSIELSQNFSNNNNNEILNEMEKQRDALISQMKEIHELLAVEQAKGSRDSVVYVGPEMEYLLRKRDIELQGQLRKDIWGATIVGSVLTLGASAMIAFILKGS